VGRLGEATEGGKVIPAYICATSIWTYDGNNLEALGGKADVCKPDARVRSQQLSAGMCSGCDGDGGIRRDEYGRRVCAAMEGAKPQ